MIRCAVLAIWTIFCFTCWWIVNIWKVSVGGMADYIVLIGAIAAPFNPTLLALWMRNRAGRM